MNIPEFKNCPDCGRIPSSFYTDLGSSGMSCNNCGFSATNRDIMRADFLANSRQLPEIRVAAERIARRGLLKYAVTRFR